MKRLLRSIRQFLSELRCRNVYQVAVTYVVVGFFVIEGADLTLTRLGLPPWTVTLVIVLVGLGFPIALVMTWALEMTPEGVRVEEPEGSEETAPAPASSSLDLWVGASVLVLLLFGAWWVWGGLGEEGGAGQAEHEAIKVKARSIAVLPFEVSGSGAEEWRDGMVTTLSLNLDGAAGLRAIADRTVFAAWQKRDSAAIGASAREVLAVARDVGARYAVIGSAVQLGGDLRLAAEVHEATRGTQLGTVQVRGAPGRVTALANRLTRKVLAVLLEKSEERVPSVDLASITTAFLPALKAYLAGERRLRAGEYEAAAENFETAVDQDSSFALAYARLGLARAWLVQFEAGRRALRRAYERSGQLPKRERRIVRARHLAGEGHTWAAADTLRRLTEDYPDDPSVWYFLGERVYHSAPPFYGAVPGGLPEAEAAFQRAARLDPGFAQYHHHLVSLAFNLHRDSALATERIQSHPEGMINRTHKLSWDLVFGSAKKRERALARVKQFSVSDRHIFFLGSLELNLRHPTDGALREKVLLNLKEREDLRGFHASYINPTLVMTSLARGQVEKATARLRTLELQAPVPSCLPVWSETLGIAVADSTLRPRLEPSRIGDGASARRLLCAGIYLVEDGRNKDLPALTDRLEEAGAEQGLSEGEVQRWTRELEGYRAFREGDLKRAERLLARHNESSYWGAIWRGDLYLKLGKLQEAEGWYQAAWWYPLAHQRLGMLYEEMNKPEKAKAAYERFVEAWNDANPELQNRVQTARERLEALRTEQAAE